MTDKNGVHGGFGFQTSDQAAHAAHQHHQYSQYNAERNAIAQSAPRHSTQAHVQDPGLNYPQLGAQQQVEEPGFPGFGFNPSVPQEDWNWTNSVDFPEYNQYEPQGELVQEFQNQPTAHNDFSIPPPIANTRSTYSTYQQAHNTNPEPPPALRSQDSSSSSLPPPLRSAHQRPVVRTAMKRKAADSDLNSIESQGARVIENPSKRPNRSQQSSDISETSPVAETFTTSPSPQMTQIATARKVDGSEPPTAVQDDDTTDRKRTQNKGTGPQGRVIDVSKPRKVAESSGSLNILPAGKVFPIQIGSELFRLSGASLSSDAPSYFSHFFSQQLHENGGRAGDVRTLYIDRDPDTFREIALHLQGYHITPKDGEHFVKLFADAQFYSLPRLTKQLFKTDIFVRIGGRPFQIPRDLFSTPGNSPNYFSLGFAQFFSTPSEVFPGLDRSALLRPPSISPPSVPNKDGETFEQLIQILQGYNVEIRDSEHRSRLLRDARYFHLKGLEQQLIPCQISYNFKREQHEILLRLEDIRQSGVSFTSDQDFNSSSSSKAPSPSPSLTSSTVTSQAGFITYARPYTDDHTTSKTLILEISAAETTTLYFPSSPSIDSSSPFILTIGLRATFHKATLARVTSLFSVIAAKMGLPATQPLGLMYLQSGAGVAAQPVSPANSGVSERRVRVRLDEECALELDGERVEVGIDDESGFVGIRRTSGEWVWGGARAESVTDDGAEWVVKRAHWRIRVEPVSGEGEERRMQVVLCGVKIEAFCKERTRNSERAFLS